MPRCPIKLGFMKDTVFPLVSVLLAASAPFFEVANANPANLIVGPASSKPAEPPDPKYYYCWTGHARVFADRVFCVMDEAQPSSVRYLILGEAVHLEDVKDDVEETVLSVTGLVGTKFVESKSPDILVVLSDRSNQDERDTTALIDDPLVIVEAKLLDELDRLSQHARGCLIAPYPRTSGVNAKTAAIVDLQALPPSSASGCIEEAFYGHFGISKAEQLPISDAFWQAHSGMQNYRSYCEIGWKPLPFMHLPLARKYGMLLSEMPPLGVLRSCFSWGGTVF